MNDEELVQILWDYMQMNHNLKKSDCIIALGTVDSYVANVAAKLYLEGYSDKIIFSGGLGKITYKLWNETEADKFAKIAIKEGVHKKDIFIENKSTNTGDNFRLTKKLIEDKKLNIKSCIVVCKPFDEKRAYAAFKQLMPEYEVIVTSQKEIKCKDYFENYDKIANSKNEGINVLVGDVQRMKVFAEKKWQIPMEIPDDVWYAYEELVKRGYNKYIIGEDV